MLSENVFKLSGSFRLLDQLYLNLDLMWKFEQIFLSAEKNAFTNKKHVWCMLVTLFLFAPIFCIASTQPEDLDILSSDFQLAALCKIMPCQDYLYWRYGMMKAGSAKRFLGKWHSANFNRSLEQPVSNRACRAFVPPPIMWLMLTAWVLILVSFLLFHQLNVKMMSIFHEHNTNGESFSVDTFSAF